MKKTALHSLHIARGGKMVPFAGWEMPIQYSAGVLSEHQACRERVALFDVSHMGEIWITGTGASAFLDRLVTQRVEKTSVGKAFYSVLCHRSGGIVDDLVTYVLGKDRFFLVVNAANTEKDWAWIQEIYQEEKWISRDVKIDQVSADFTQIAIQGPKAAETLRRLLGERPLALPTYGCLEMNWQKVPMIVGRTGYTGEDGFELYLPWSEGESMWKALEEAGKEFGIALCGLAARDTLRLEMKYPLYGQDLTDETTPLEAGLGWVVDLEKSDFIGKESLVRQKTEGISRKWVGLKILDPGIARTGYEVWDATKSQKIGVLSSGTFSPVLQASVATAYLPLSFGKFGEKIAVKVRDRFLSAEIVKTPFIQVKSTKPAS
jgi:aminomethyltransferase